MRGSGSRTHRARSATLRQLRPLKRGIPPYVDRERRTQAPLPTEVPRRSRLSRVARALRSIGRGLLVGAAGTTTSHQTVTHAVVRKLIGTEGARTVRVQVTGEGGQFTHGLSTQRFDRRGKRARLSRALLCALPAAAVLCAGCGSEGGLKSDGPAPAAVGPARLWPELPQPKGKKGEGPAEPSVQVVKGVKVPGGDLRKVDPLDVVKAEAGTHPNTFKGPDGAPQELKGIRQCNAGQQVKACPVLKPHYRDLTGSGQDELIVGVRYVDNDYVDIRVYRQVGDQLVRIMAYAQSVMGVELAGQDIIIRSPAYIADYELREVWAWDSQQRAILPQSAELVHDESSKSHPSSAATPSDAQIRSKRAS